MFALLRSRLSPFRHSNFRRFFFVQTLSLTGSWAHDLARAWIIINMMGKAGALGSLMMAIAIPSLFFILHGGVIVDRVDVRKMMMITKGLLGVLSIVIAVVVEAGHVQFWHLLLFGIIEGCIVAFDSPAYQTLSVRLIPREDFQQAMAINSTNFHAARMLGPLVAGALMAWHGPSAVFLFDGITFLLLVWLLGSLSLREGQRKADDGKSDLQALWDGLLYTWNTSSIRYKTLQLMTAIVLVFPMLLVVFRTYIQHKFKLDAENFGYVFTLPALGSMLGALSFTIVKPVRPIRALYFGIPMASLSMYALTFTDSIPLSSVLMSMTGFFMYLNFASLTVSMHLEVKEEYRGRLGSVIGLCFVSLGPLMSFPIGIFADAVGFETAIHIGAIAFLVVSLLLYILHRKSLHTEEISPRTLGTSQIH